MVYIVACTPEKMNHVKQGDLVVTADREDVQRAALEKGVACLVLSRGFEPSEEIIALGKKQKERRPNDIENLPWENVHIGEFKS